MIKTILLSIILFYILWLFINFISLLYKNSAVINSFKKLEELLIKRYELTGRLLKSDEHQKYLAELVSLPRGVKFINRKLALNYILSEYIKQQIQVTELPEEYKAITSELEIAGDVYNHRAQILKQAVEIFPKSFYARFMNIKFTDFYRG